MFVCTVHFVKDLVIDLQLCKTACDWSISLHFCLQVPDVCVYCMFC